MRLAWGAKVSSQFAARVVAIANELGIDASYLMACMAFESGLDPEKVNASSGATGLIQFMPHTAEALGTTTGELSYMSGVEQLEYVRRYLLPYAGRMHTLADLYMAILWPAAVSAQQDEVIFSGGSQAYLLNRVLDVDRNGEVTKAEATAFVQRKLTEGLDVENVLTDEVADDVETTAPIPETPPPETGTIPAPTETPTTSKGTVMPLLMSLLPLVLNLFAPLAQEKIARVTKNDQGAQQLIQALIGKGAELTGLPVDQPVQVVAALQKAQADNPVIVQQLEDHALDFVDKLLPLIDRMAALDKSRWDADDRSADSAALRGKTDQLDIAPTLARRGDYTFAAAILGMVAIAALQMYFDSAHKLDGQLVGLITILVYAIARSFERPRAYRWGGIHQSDATDVANAAAARRITEKS